MSKVHDPIRLRVVVVSNILNIVKPDADHDVETYHIVIWKLSMISFFTVHKYFEVLRFKAAVQ